MKASKRGYRSEVAPVKVEGNLAYIQLTKGYTAVIDTIDLELVAPHSWRAYIARRTDGSIRAVYAYTSIRQPNGKYKVFALHRYILKPDDTQVIDHIDSDGLNNTRSNMRVCVQNQNGRNRRRQSNNTSGFKGVTQVRGYALWKAQIAVNSRTYALGTYSSKEEAAQAYDNAAINIYGSFARTNKQLSLSA